MKNFLGLNANTFYIPFNTITESCSFRSSVVDSNELASRIKCPLNNLNGTTMLIITFSTLGTGFMDQHKVLYIQQFINKGINSRKEFITTQFSNINNAAYDVSMCQEDIENMIKSDADVKAKKLASINTLTIQISTLEAQLAVLKSKKIALSKDLQNIKTTGSDITINKKANIAIKIALLTTIETLKTKITGGDIITQMTTKQTSDMTFLKYWLQGSIYHRITKESEVATLIGLANDKSQFVTQINDFFFPQ